MPSGAAREPHSILLREPGCGSAQVVGEDLFTQVVGMPGMLGDLAKDLPLHSGCCTAGWDVDGVRDDVLEHLGTRRAGVR